ncbi:hypothetical protein K2Y11_00995 [bacterium]|nr:hypothetical protein [bacterium]
MFFSRFAFTIACLVTLASTAMAHGPQIQITNTGDKIVTRNIFSDEPYTPLTDPISVYVLPLNLEPNGTYYVQPNDEINAGTGLPAFPSGPGITYGLGSTFASGYRFTLNLVDGLKLWNGTTWVDPGTEQIQAYRGSETAPTASAITSDSSPFASFNFSNIPANYAASAHSSVSYRLLGDGVSGTAASDDGIYLLSMQLSSNQPGLASSDTFYFVLYKNVGRAEALEAVQSLGVSPAAVQVVPEVGSMTLMGLAGLTMVGAVLRKRWIARV